MKTEKIARRRGIQGEKPMIFAKVSGAKGVLLISFPV